MFITDSAKDYTNFEILSENDEFILTAANHRKNTGDRVTIKTIFKKRYQNNRKLSKRLANEI